MLNDSPYISDLQGIIFALHDAHSTHLESVRVKESFQGRTVWDGIVEVFGLHEHPLSPKVYAWSHDTDDPENPKRHVTVLHVGPVTSPQAAVRAAIVQEYRNAN